MAVKYTVFYITQYLMLQNIVQRKFVSYMNSVSFLSFRKIYHYS